MFIELVYRINIDDAIRQFKLLIPSEREERYNTLELRLRFGFTLFKTIPFIFYSYKMLIHNC